MSDTHEVRTAPGPAVPTVSRIGLTADDVHHLTHLLDDLAGAHGTSTDAAFLAEAPRLAWNLPRALVRSVTEFRRHEVSAALVISGLPVEDGAIGPTPLDWRSRRAPSPTLHQELYQVLVASLLGEVFGWSTLQGGRLIHDVVPIPSEKEEQSGHGTVQLEWHTEDGFHPCRCDYLLLLGLRNHDAVPTTVASVDTVALPPRARRVLHERRFLIKPDNEHLKRAQDLVAGFSGEHPIQVMQRRPEPCAVLFGDPERPYLRVDPAFMEAVPSDREAQQALATLVRRLDENLEQVALLPGDLLIVDNYKAVHGRSAFRARYDGTDRWLKKVVVTRDLRKSRSLRAAPGERVLL